MEQIAVFVDAGYLLAAGGSLVAGTPVPRSVITLHVGEAVKALREAAREAAPDSRLLRIYWYDGVGLYAGPSAEQTSIAFSPDIKLRLGTINSRGQQKGVDSLIITDLIDLARNKAITDALIVAGDEDLRVAVQVAQSYGVRVSLLGVAPSTANQSYQLTQEADALLEWAKEKVSEVISVRTPNQDVMVSRPTLEHPSNPKNASSGPDYAGTIQEILTAFDNTQIEQFKLLVRESESLPREIDAPMLGKIRDAIQRDLTPEEKRTARKIARDKLR